MASAVPFVSPCHRYMREKVLPLCLRSIHTCLWTGLQWLVFQSHAVPLALTCWWWVPCLLCPLLCVSPRGLWGTRAGGKQSCHDTTPPGGITAKVMPWASKSCPWDKTSATLGALMAPPCPPLGAYCLLVGPGWCHCLFIISGGRAWPPAQLDDFIQSGRSLLGIWPFLTQSSTSSTAFLRDDCSDEAINYKADLTCAQV